MVMDDGMRIIEMGDFDCFGAHAMSWEKQNARHHAIQMPRHNVCQKCLEYAVKNHS